MSYLTRSGALYLQNFPNTSYKFSVINKSLSEAFVLNSFWNWFTPRFIPEYVAPNMVTFVGFMCVIGAWMLQCLHENYPAVLSAAEEAMTHQANSLSFVSSLDSFIQNQMLHSFLHSVLAFLSEHCFLIMAILFFVYQTLDGCDGKQARRTRNSTPLGEVLDHGVDAISASIFMFSLVYALDKQYIFSGVDQFQSVGITSYSRPGMTPRDLLTADDTQSLASYFNLWTLLSSKTLFFRIYNYLYSCSLQIIFAWAFFGAHVQHYHRGTFFMAELGACDLENLIIGAQLVRYFFGSNIYHFVLYEHWLVGQIDVGGAVILVIILSTIGGVLQSLIDVLVNADKPRKQSIMLQFLPLAVYSILGFIYGLSNPLVVATNFMTYATMMTMPFGVILTSLNIARVTDSKMNVFGFQIMAGVILPLVALVGNTFLELVDEVTLLRLACVYCVGFYIHFASSVIGSFCGALQINFLTINRVAPVKKTE